MLRHYRKFAGSVQPRFRGKELIHQIAKCRGVVWVSRSRDAAGAQVVFLGEPACKGFLVIGPDAEEVNLAEHFLGPLAIGVRKQRKIFVGLLWLAGLAGPRGRCRIDLCHGVAP
jgi:hypothetical protein